MRLLVQRTFAAGAKRTPGTLRVINSDGSSSFFCFTLEDEVREPASLPVELSASSSFEQKEAWVKKWKVPKETAIPTGAYDLRLSFSNRFQKILPEILLVPGFTGIRLHFGRDEKDTEGCVLIGKNRVNGVLKDSATEALVGLLYKQATGSKHKIVIENA